MKHLRFLPFGAALVFGIALMGCSTEGPVSTVSGKVTLDGKDAKEGTITFTTQDGKQRGTATIGSDGKYECKNAPVGKCKVSVVAIGAASGDPMAGKAKDSGPVAQYEELSYEVTKAPSTFDAAFKKKS